jgi:hypothetical protein
MENQAYWPGIAADRIVAIVAGLDTGKIQIGSGYLLSSGTVLTARHCTYDVLTQCRLAYFDHAATWGFSRLTSLIVGGELWRVPWSPGLFTR